MQIFGFQITRVEKRVPTTLSGVDSRGGWWPVIRESVAGAWQSNVEVDLANVLTYSPVYAGLRLISTDIATLRPRIVQLDEESGIWTETDRPAFSPILRQPNHYQGRIEFFEYWILQKLIHGNTYILKERDNRNVVRAMYVLDSTRVRVLVAPDSSVYYQLQADNLSGIGEEVTVPASEIIHDKTSMFYHPLVGISPLTACGIPAIEALRIQENSTVFFANGSQPGGVLTAPGSIPQATADRIKAYWDTNFTGANAGKVAVLGDNLKYERTGLVSATDAQLVEQLQWTAEDVCQALGIPRHKLGVGPDPTYNNIEALNLDYYGRCLKEKIEKIEELLDFALGLSPHKIDGVRLGVEFDVSDLLRMDTTGRVNAASIAIRSGMSPDEVRARYFDLGKVEGGENPLLQEQNWPIPHLANRPLPERPITAPAEITDGPSGSEDMPDQPENEEEQTRMVEDLFRKELGLVA